MKAKIRVLHTFDKYLPTSMNWLYSLLAGFNDSKVVITADLFLKNNFFSNKFQYVEFPIQPIDNINSSGKQFFRFFLRKITNVIRKLYWIYLKNNCRDVEIVHSHFANNGWYYFRFVKNLGVPHIISFYGWDYQMLINKYPIYLQRYKEMFSSCAAFICEGTNGKNLLVKLGCPPEKIHVFHLGVDLKKIEYFRRKKVANELILIQVASFTEKKGHFYTVKAFAKAHKICQNLKLIIVGASTGSILESINNIIAHNKIASKVRIIEALPLEEVYILMNQAHLFIHPSVHASNGDCEGGAPVVILDAQATGLPVLSTNHCDIPEEVLHGSTGLLSEEYDYLNLAENIIHFYRMEQDEYDKFSINARIHVERNYNINENAKLIENFYRTLLNRS